MRNSNNNSQISNSINTNTNIPTLTQFVHTLDVLNELLTPQQCQQIGEYIDSIQTQLASYHNSKTVMNTRGIQINDSERDNSLALAHSMKMYATQLQNQLYLSRQLLSEKDNTIEELNNEDWVRQVTYYKNINQSISRQLMFQEKETKKLYQMFSELTNKIDRNLPDSSILRNKITEFINTYNKKIFHLTSQLAEKSRRSNEKQKNWSELQEKIKRLEMKNLNLNKVLHTQRENMSRILNEKNLLLTKTNRQLSIISGGNAQGTPDQQLAAKFLFETLSKYTNESDKSNVLIERLEEEIATKTQKIQELEEKYQIKCDSFNRISDNGPQNSIQTLQEQLNEETKHNGIERISKLEDLLFAVQTKLSQLQQKNEVLVAENRQMCEKLPLNEIDTISFLSKSIHVKDDHINKLQKIIEKQSIQIKKYTMLEQKYKSRETEYEKEIENITKHHQKVNNILGNMKAPKYDTENNDNNNVNVHNTINRKHLFENLSIIDENNEQEQSMSDVSSVVMNGSNDIHHINKKIDEILNANGRRSVQFLNSTNVNAEMKQNHNGNTNNAIEAVELSIQDV